MKPDRQLLNELHCKSVQEFSETLEKIIREGNRYYKAEIRMYKDGSEERQLIQSLLDGRVEVLAELLKQTKRVLEYDEL